MNERSVLLTSTRPPLIHEISKWKNNGFKVYYQQLLNIVNLPIAPLTINPQAIVLTSANAAANLRNSDWDRNIQVFGVGPATVSAAKASGFKDCTSPSSMAYPSAMNIINWIKKNLLTENGIIVHGSGEHLRHDVAGVLKNYGFETLRIVLYKTEKASEFSHEIEFALKNETIKDVSFTSEQSMQTFVGLCKKYEIDFKKITPLLPNSYMERYARKAGLVI